MEENRRFSWSDLFIKMILVIIFVLFTVWLLSLSNNGLSNSLNVLTDNIFSENMEKMRDVGKGYFTTERLPQKVGEVETLTLEKMYDKKLILELKDKNGNACSAKNSYVSIEKYDNEYQMKVYLECGEESDYIIVIMGCYDYCDTDICEKVETEIVEYEYKKTIGGKWSDYGKWSEWSKVSVSKNDYRQVETKKEKEEYSYDKTITEKVYEEYETTCPNGYTLTADGTRCYKTVTDYSYSDPKCEVPSGYTLVSQNGFTCTYSKPVVNLIKPECPVVSGYTNTGRNGFTCSYSRTVQSSDYTLEYVTTKKGSYVPGDTSTYAYKEVGYPEVEFSCNDSCVMVYIHTYKVYKKVYGTTTETTTKTAECKSGYNNGNGMCAVTGSEETTGTAICLVGSPSGNKCAKPETKDLYEDLVKTCPVNYELVDDGSKCYDEVSSTTKVTDTKEVTYYRYRVREYIGGTPDYKWSTSKNDKELLDAGYKLTGRTR